MSSVLAGFLVRLGFVVDKDEQAKFQASIDYAGKRMKEIAMRGAAMGTAFSAAFAKSTQETNRFYNITNQIGGSVRGLNNVASAVAKVGGNVDEATNSLKTFANKLTFIPGMADYTKNLTGVDVRDKTGKLREYSDILLDLIERWKKTGDAVGRVEASFLGLDGAYASLMKKDFPAELKKTNEQQGELADMVDKSADSVHRLSNEFSRTWEIISMGSQAAFGTLSDSLGLDKVAEKFNKTLSQELPAWIQTEKNIWNQSHGVGDYLKNFFFKADEFQDAERYKRHLMDDEQVQKFLRKKYTKQKSVLDDEAEEGVSIVDDFDKKGFEEELARYRAAKKAAAQPAKPAQAEPPPVPGKMSRGLRNNNPGNMRPVSRNQPNDGAFAIYRTPEEGWGALGRQLKGYANAGLDNVASIISKYAPAADHNETGPYIQSVTANMSRRLGSDVGALTRLDLSDPRVLKALMQSITEHENFRGASQYFEGASFDKEVLAAAQSQWRSKVVNERDKIPSWGSVVVNQNITINGADNPRAVGQAVAHETLLAQNRYGQRNLS